tara:strand:+ start:26128 stop:26856 length:729 start_codon:yes stop_codon:yes gene_type:complete
LLIKLPKRHLDAVVLGGNITSFLYSHENNLPLIINNVEKPHRFAKINNVNALSLWHKLFYSLSLSGLNLLGLKAQSIRIKEEELSATTKDARVIKFDYNKLIIFDDESIYGLPQPVEENKDFVVLDWIAAKSCQAHEHKHWKTKDSLVNELYFYPTERMDGHHPNRKDLVAISFLNKEQLKDFEYSDTYAKFKVMDMMKKHGIGGRKCGGGNQYALKLEVEKREIRKARMSLYKNTEKMEFR